MWGEPLLPMSSLCSLSYQKTMQIYDTTYSFFLERSGCQMTGFGIKSLRDQMGIYWKLVRLFNQCFKNQFNSLPNPLEIHWGSIGNWLNSLVSPLTVKFLTKSFKNQLGIC